MKSFYADENFDPDSVEDLLRSSDEFGDTIRRVHKVASSSSNFKITIYHDYKVTTHDVDTTPQRIEVYPDDRYGLRLKFELPNTKYEMYCGAVKYYSSVYEAVSEHDGHVSYSYMNEDPFYSPNFDRFISIVESHGIRTHYRRLNREKTIQIDFSGHRYPVCLERGMILDFDLMMDEYSYFKSSDIPLIPR